MQNAPGNKMYTILININHLVTTSQSQIWCVPTVTECDPVCPNHVYMWASISVGILFIKMQSKDWYHSTWTPGIIMNKNPQPMDHYRLYNLVGQQGSTLVANSPWPTRSRRQAHHRMASRISHSRTSRSPWPNAPKTPENAIPTNPWFLNVILKKDIHICAHQWQS